MTGPGDLATMQALFSGAGVTLSPEDWAFFERLRLAVVAANATMNLTRLTEPADFYPKHVLDSLLPLVAVPELAALGEGILAADLGSGAGFPGFVLARMRPSWDVALLERTRKKAAFLEQCASDLGMENVFVVPFDAAEAAAAVPLLERRCGLVTARAVGRIAAVTKSAAGLLAPRGLLAHYKGGTVPRDELEEGARAARRLGFFQRPPVSYALPPDSRRSIVLTLSRPSDRRHGARRRPTRARRERSGGRGR